MSEIPDAATSDRASAPAPPWQRRVASAVVTIVTRFLGLGLVFSGGASTLTAGTGDATVGTADWVSVAAGLVLIGISAASMIVSTCGVIIVACTEIVVSLLGLVIPFSLGSRDVHPVNWPRAVYAVVFPDGAELAGFATASGFLLVLGAVSLAAALGHRGRRRSGSRVSPLRRIVAMGGAVVLSIPGAVLVWAGGYHQVVAYRVFVSPDVAVGPVIMIIAGALLCAAIAAAGRLSAAALYAFGLFWVTMWVAFGAFLSGATPETVSIIPAWATTTAVIWGVSGLSASVALFLLVSGGVMRFVALSTRRVAPPVDAES
ncbi:hypothetical protein [Paramicrobacterium agarici]|uniref:Uncharacterized protein n=1 Tax=Paramicrobacterium agarici TaxID=630514 RepID=A0A2A9DYY3_9MICO|nr:hypothetical protein [Microbacterium agarici]PFG31804.1 hypothetical protein ATJ78_2784 [Microbacterium agarici]